MSIPVAVEITLPYYDKRTPRFQVLELNNNGVLVPVTDDLSAQTITLYIKSETDANFTPISKDFVTENWIIDNVNKYIQPVIDTVAYSMTEGDYIGEIEWEDMKRTLIVLNIHVTADVRH